MAKYAFTSIWKIKASREEVYNILEDVGTLTKWWPSVYLDVNILEKGDENGIGKKVKLHTKGWLPYTLKWDFEVINVKFPTGFSLKAIGDFIGSGEWKFTTLDHLTTEVRYDWNIEVTKPFLKFFTPVLRPVFAANHRWAMAKGEESLRQEVLRRRIMNSSKMHVRTA
jgi:Polyketide cyclase / dehydrase and lipid transport